MAGNLGWYDRDLAPLVLYDEELNILIGTYDPEWADAAAVAFVRPMLTVIGQAIQRGSTV
jgi:hypothetical protein